MLKGSICSPGSCAVTFFQQMNILLLLTALYINILNSEILKYNQRVILRDIHIVIVKLSEEFK